MRILTPAEIDEAASLLIEEEIVGFPTETVYGLGARIFSKKAIEKIFVAKQRPVDNPLIAHIAHVEDVHKIARDIPEEFALLAQAFWPGPLSILLSARKEVPWECRANLPTIAVRMPEHSLALALIKKVGEPLVAPSANLSGKPSATCAKHVVEDFAGKIQAVLDGGLCREGIESTVLSLEDPTRPLILRRGVISEEILSSFLKRPVIFSGSGMVKAPGMKYRHYAPKTPIRLVFREQFAEEKSPSKLFLQRKDGSLSPRTFYDMLRQADHRSMDEIVILCDQETETHRAFFDRITKAASL